MGKLGCSVDGNLNENKFSEPMPWIGIYIAAGSLACAVAMAADVVRGIRHRKFWFPCKYFSINATSLTVIAVAIKLSLDLNTGMPRHQEQLSKLSSAVLACTVMGNSMPSLGTMETRELLMNIMALGILVITLVVNICIQIGTGVIYVFWREHAFIMFLMLVLLMLLIFSALTIPTTKYYLERKYRKKYELAMKEGLNETANRDVKKLKEDLMKYWMMAHTCSPQFVIGRSVTCIAAGAICLLSSATLAEAMALSSLLPRSVNFCKGESEYKWSITLILVIQTIAVGIGTIGPASRWFMAINFRCPTRMKERCRNEFKLERYWIYSLVEMKGCPLTIPFRFQNQHSRKLVHVVKCRSLDVCIRIQTGIVFISKVIRLISVCLVLQILSFCNCFRALKKIFNTSNSLTNDSGSESQPSTKLDLSRFVLHLEGENQLVGLMMKENRDATNHWVQSGKQKPPKHLTQLLQISRVSEGFPGVGEFDSDQVPSLDAEVPPNCWALPVVTLTSIAIALPRVKHHSIKQLIHGLNEGLIYVRLIERKLNAEGAVRNIRKAADLLWLGVELYQKWLDVNLHKLSHQEKSPKEILEVLCESARNKFMEFKVNNANQCLMDSASKWPAKILAANSMYRISQTILLNYENREHQTGETLFEALALMISDILGACLTNLQRVISIKCLNSTIEEREESVRHAAYLLGETEDILNILNKGELPQLDPDKMACIDEWRLLYKLKKPQLYSPTLSKSDTGSLTSSDVHLNME